MCAAAGLQIAQRTRLLDDGVLVQGNGSEKRRASFPIAPLQARAQLRQTRHLCGVALARRVVQLLSGVA
jgi:hypothetical protein